MSDDEAQRLDKWLWCTRLFKTRALAGKTIGAQGVRVTRHGTTQVTEKAGFGVRVGDMLGFTKGERVHVVEVLGLAVRRGPATEAQALYIDHSPPPLPRPKRPVPIAPREAGAGRPTKKERRAMDAFREQSDQDAE